MRISVLILSILLAALIFFEFLVDTGVLAVIVRAAIFLVLVAQALAGYFAITSASKAATEARLEITDVLAPLTAALKDIPLEPRVKRQQTVVSFLTYATASCILLAKGPKLGATFFEVRGEAQCKVLAPTRISAGSASQAQIAFAYSFDGVAGDFWRDALKGRPRLVPDIRKTGLSKADKSVLREWRSFIAMPVMVEGKPVGMLVVRSPQKGGLGVSDITTMRIVSELCTTAIAGNGGECPFIGGVKFTVWESGSSFYRPRDARGGRVVRESMNSRSNPRSKSQRPRTERTSMSARHATSVKRRKGSDPESIAKSLEDHEWQMSEKRYRILREPESFYGKTKGASLEISRGCGLDGWEA